MKNQEVYFDPNYPLTEDAYGFDYSNAEFKVRKMTQNRPIKREGGKVKIEIEIEQYQYMGKGKSDRKRFFVDTNIFVDSKHWNNKSQKLSQKEENYEVKTNKINKVFALVQTIIASKGQQEIDDVYGEGVDFSKLREIFPNRKENRKTFYDYMLKYKDIRETDGDTAPSTIKRINTVCRSIKAFDEYQGKKTYVENVTFLWSDDFNAWLVRTKKFVPSTIDRTYQIISGGLKYLWKRRKDLELKLSDDFRDADFKYGKKTPNKAHALSKEQRDIIYNHRFVKPYLEKARKMMCIQMYSACRYSDIKRFTPENFREKGKLIFTPLKTKRYEIVVKQPLTPALNALYEEVNYFTGEIYSTKSQNYNPYILEVFKELQKEYPKAEFTADYTSHNMRDTAISIWVKSGVNFKSILRWSGQKKYETLDVYIDLDADFERQEMDKTL